MLTGGGNPAHADADHTGLAAIGFGGIMLFCNCALNKSD